MVTNDGEVHVALLVEQNDKGIVMRDIQGTGSVKTFPTADIDEAKLLSTSMMPAGSVNQLNSRQQFLDLVRYLIEIRDGGSQRAAELQPSASLIAFTVPEYEQHLDHAGIISGWDGDSIERGEAIYKRVCANCHGTHNQLGSLPTSLSICRRQVQEWQRSSFDVSNINPRLRPDDAPVLDGTLTKIRRDSLHT